MSDADVLIVGGGIAGFSAAYFASRRGRRVTLIDEGLQRASDLPIALVNPLRGHAGRLITHGVDGMHATFALIYALREQGHRIDAARGLYRPLIDRGGEAIEEAYWRQRLEGKLAFDWHARAPLSLGLVDAVPTLHLRDAGWVASPTLLRALLAATDLTLVKERVTHVDAHATAQLANGTTIRARTMLWCAGARGAAGLDASGSTDATAGSPMPPDALYKPGSLLTTSEPLTREPLSFGFYAAPLGDHTLIGPTREDSHANFPDGEVDAAAIAHLEERVARTFGKTVALQPIWRGVRLTRLSTNAARALQGVANLTAFGSRGFLMAPLRAAEWAQSL
jgi:glycine/D-amino acid oxidase-like deaminating enzyme